jgi:hypothetical protein
VDTILIFPDGRAATAASDRGNAGPVDVVIGGSPESVPVGRSGVVVAGASPDGSKSLSPRLFTEGRAFVTFEFVSGPNNPIETEFFVSVGQQQAARIKKFL